ncbi:MAG: hypothetical protein AB7V32_10115 [Candidatus Berkiella sp.]
MRIIKTIFIIALFNIACANASEECDYTHRWWLNLAGGIGSTFGDGNANVDGQSAAQISFNGMITEKLFTTLALTGLGRDNDEQAHEQAILLGYKSKKPNWYWGLAAGVGHLEIENKISYYSYKPSLFGAGTTYYTSYTQSEDYLSFPVQGQLFWTPFKHFGVGLIAHASFGKKTMTTGLLGIQFS